METEIQIQKRGKRRRDPDQSVMLRTTAKKQRKISDYLKENVSHTKGDTTREKLSSITLGEHAREILTYVDLNNEPTNRQEDLEVSTDEISSYVDGNGESTKEISTPVDEQMETTTVVKSGTLEEGF